MLPISTILSRFLPNFRWVRSADSVIFRHGCFYISVNSDASYQLVRADFFDIFLCLIPAFLSSRRNGGKMNRTYTGHTQTEKKTTKKLLDEHRDSKHKKSIYGYKNA